MNGSGAIQKGFDHSVRGPVIPIRYVHLMFNLNPIGACAWFLVPSLTSRHSPLDRPSVVLQSSTASPTLQAVFNDAPRTNMRDGDENEDRLALLPELNRTLSQVSELLGGLVHRGRSRNTELESSIAGTGRGRRIQPDLPWISEDAGDDDDGVDGFDDDDDDDITTTLPPLVTTVDEPTAVLRSVPSNIVEPIDEVDDDGVINAAEGRAQYGRVPRPIYNQRELRSLAAILDRLGRTLTDAAPHIASLAASLPEDTATAPLPSTSNVQRDGTRSEELTSSAPLGGLLSLWSRERRRHAAEEQSSTARVDAVAPALDPDHTDYSGALVNTTRGDARGGSRSRASQDDVANLLGAYLAAASLGSLMGAEDDNGDEAATGLGRLLRDRGAGGVGGGIDIHIHAVLTAPGVAPGGLGIATLGGGAGGTGTFAGTRNLFSVARAGGSRSGGSLLRSRNSPSFANTDPDSDDDYNDLFSELYSENPPPVDPNGSQGPGERPIGTISPDRNRTGTSEASVRVSRDDLSRGDSLDDPSLGASQQRSRSSRSSPRRHSTTERRSGMFRLFRRRSRSNQNQSENDDP
jgi:hypothetical protein